MIAITVAGIPGCGSRRDLPQVTLPDMVPADEIPQTDVLPHAQGDIVPGRNYVYCATFQLAWNELQNRIIEEPILLDGTPPMADFLNQQAFRREDLSKDAYLAKAGAVKDGVVDQLREQMRRRFPDAAFEVPKKLEQNVYVAYAYLQKSLPFREVFDRLTDPVAFRSEAGVDNVAAFGVRDFDDQSDRSAALKKQVTILSYVSDDDFVVRLNAASSKDELVLAKVPRQKTLAATLRAVRERIEQRDKQDHVSSLQYEETLAIPIVTLGVWREYTELLGRDILNPDFLGLYVSVARQGIRFRLDETGARLESGAYLAAKCAEPPQRRRFVFDRPFLLYLRETKSDRPYLAMWIETPELLEKRP